MVYEKIKFAGRYEKLHGQTSAQLISVQVLRISGGDRTFEKLIDYDTIREDGTRYRITPCEYILLVFVGSDWIPFTTLRCYTAKKYEYYKSLIGKLMDADAHRKEFMEFVYAELQDDADNCRANRIIDFFDTIPTVLEASDPRQMELFQEATE